MQEQPFIEYKLIGKNKPVNFQVPLNNVMLTKKGEQGLRKIQYIQGSTSIYKEDHKGDEKPSKIWLVNGSMRVHKNDLVLLEIMERHPLNGRDFEASNPTKEATIKLNKYQLIEKALDKVNIANEDEKKATALILIGEHVLSYSEQMVTAELKEKAFESPEDLIRQMSSHDYHAKYIAALGILRGVLEINPSRTAVTWPDGKVLITVPVGQSPVDNLGAFLSENKEENKITLQTIGEHIKRSYVKQNPIDVDAAIEEVASSSSIEGYDSSEKYNINEIQKFYSDNIGNLPPNKKNDIDWLKGKLDEK